MVQIVNVDPKPSIWAALGQGLGQGISSGVEMGLAAKMQDMYDQKKAARTQAEQGAKGLAVLKMLKPNASQEEQAVAYTLGADMTMKLLDNLGESGFASFVASGNVPTGQAPAMSNKKEQPPETNVLGQAPTQNINIQGMPDRQATAQQQQQPPFMLPQQQQQVQQSPQQVQQQAQRPTIPDQAMQRAASMSDRDWASWLDRQQISKDWKIKYSNERRKQQEMDLKQRADLREEEERGEKRAKFQLELKKQPKEVVKYVQDQTKAASSSRDIVKILDRMADLRKTGRTGWAMGGAISPENRKTRAEYDGLASQLIKLYKNVAGSKGVTQQEFAKIADEWLPSSKFTEATNEGREDHFRFEAQTALKDFEKMRSLVGEDGKYPLDIQERVAESDEQTEVPSQQVYPSLPDPSQFKTGDVMRDTKTGRRMIHNGFTWVEAK